MSYTIMRLKQVIKQTGLSRSSIYRRIKQNNFPQQVSLGGRSVGWVSTEVDQWVSERVDASRAVATCPEN